MSNDAGKIARIAKPKVRHVDFYPDEWLAGTAKMSPLDVGVYITACALIYSHGEAVEESELGRFLACHGNALKAAVARLVASGKLVRIGSKLWSIRCGNELEKAQKRIRNSSENGQKGGRPSGTIQENQDVTESSGITLPITTNYQPPTERKEDPPISPPLAGGDATAKTRRQAGHRIDPEWVPNAEGRSFAVSLDLDPEWVGDEFRDYWLAESGPKAAKRDWDRAFKTRCRTLAEQGRGRKAGPNQNGHRSPTPLVNQSEGFFRAAEKLIRDQGNSGSGEPFDEPLLDSGRAGDTAAGAGRGLARRLN